VVSEQLIPITGEYITLAQLLKKLNYIASGGESRFFLQTHNILVNGVPEQRRGRKLYTGDSISIDGQTYVLG